MLTAMLLFVISVLAGRSDLYGQSQPQRLAEFAVNIDGATTFHSLGEVFPPGVSFDGFDRTTGLGQVTVKIYGAGPHYFGALVDHEIDETINTFYNEFGTAVGTPLPGQSWEIDEPGYKFGDLFAHFASGRLDNSNGVPVNAADDTAMALAWNFSLSSTQTALIRLTMGETVPLSGLYLMQSDSASGRTLYYSGTLSTYMDDDRPPSIICPGDVIADADPGQCYRDGLAFAVTVEDDNPGASLACQPPSGSRFPVGTTSVRCVATDAGGNTNSCAFSVTIRGTPPLIQCPGNIIEECVPAGGQIVRFTATASTVSACASNVSVICVPPSGSVFPLGPTAVNCAARDSTGARSECSFTVFLVGTNCLGEFSLEKSTCLAGEVHADPLLQPYPCGTCVEITGVPAEGWTFLGWLGDARGFDQTVQLTMTQNKCVEAVFGTHISVGNSTNGTAWLDPIAPLYPCGSEVRGLARPAAGYYFDHWTNSIGDSINPVDFTVSKTNAVLDPVFLPLPAGQASLTVETRGLGSVRGQLTRLLNRYPVGSNVVVRAVPDAGQDFLGWTFEAAGTNGSIQLPDNPVTVAMNTSRTLVARFTDRPRIEIVRCQGELIEGIFRFQVHGRVLQRYIIEASPTLDNPIPWHEVGRATNILGAVQYEDPYLPGMPQRFYRVRVAEGDCAQANLSARQDGTQVILEWPATTCDCVLEEASSLDNPVNWSLAPVSLQVVGEKYRAIVSKGSRTKFFRLNCTSE